MTFALDCFNGAVTLSLQKSKVRLMDKDDIFMLQWSCNFIVTEILTDSIAQFRAGALQWSCNFIVTEIMILYGKPTFIELLQWSCNFIVTEICISNKIQKN